MLSLLNANNPAHTKTTKPSKIIGRRVNPNCSNPLSTAYPSIRGGRRGERIAEKQRAFGDDQFADLRAFKNLTISFVQPADLDRASGKPASIGGHPDGHG